MRPLSQKCKFWWNGFVQARTNRKCLEQLPQSLVMIANALKAGLNLHQAIEMAAKEMPEPISQKWGQVVSDMGLGETLEEALAGMQGRWPDSEVKLLVQSILTLREVGGNLVKSFETLVRIMTDRAKVVRQIRLSTIQGVSQGIFIGAMPLVFGLLMTVLAPNFMRPLWEMPLGWGVQGVVVFLESIGFLWIYKIVRIEV